MFLDKVVPKLLLGYADHREPVRDAAHQAMKVIMGNLSGYAVKNLVPKFIDGLDEDNWRSTMASSQALGNIAYCAPK